MAKGKYVDGFVFSVSAENEAAYKKMAREGAKTWKKFGALAYMECKGDQLDAPHVTFTFPKMAKTKEGETTWFSFIVFKSRKHRDQVNKKVMEHFDKKYAGQENSMPFDMKRMAYGGFKVELSA
jgi:uncharacterized protein YbaA (DUF1428 family)